MKSVLVVVGAIFISLATPVKADAIEDCFSLVDQLRSDTRGLGIEVSDKKMLKRASKSCEQAQKSAPDSGFVRSAVARVHVWEGRDSSALVHLERALIDDPDAADLAIALCASGRGGARVQKVTCDWSTQYGTDDPDVNFTAAQSMIKRGDVDFGLTILSRAADNGSAEALALTQQYCNGFNIDTPASSSYASGALGNLDPAYVGVLACQSAFDNSVVDVAGWANLGWQYMGASMYFDDYDAIAQILYGLSTSADDVTVESAIDTAVSLCLTLAGDPADPLIGDEGVAEHEIVVERAVPSCEIAAYLWPENGALHHALSRAYGMAGEDLDSYAALEAAKAAGYAIGGDFDPSGYTIPELVAAFYHGDIAMLVQVMAARQNMGVMQITFGDEFNLFLYGYMQGFITEYMAKEDFRCVDGIDITFSGKALANIELESMKAMGRFMGDALGLNGASARNSLADRNLEAIFGGGGRQPDGSIRVPFIDVIVQTKYNTVMAQNAGPRDAALFLTQTTCSDSAAPLVKNMEAFLEGVDFPYKDLFYLSRYDATSGEKILYDQCGVARVAEGVNPSEAASQCRCMVTELLNAGYADDQMMDIGRSDVLAALRTAGSGHEDVVAECRL